MSRRRSNGKVARKLDCKSEPASSPSGVRGRSRFVDLQHKGTVCARGMESLELSVTVFRANTAMSHRAIASDAIVRDPRRSNDTGTNDLALDRDLARGIIGRNDIDTVDRVHHAEEGRARAHDTVRLDDGLVHVSDDRAFLDAIETVLLFKRRTDLRQSTRA